MTEEASNRRMFDYGRRRSRPKDIRLSARSRLAVPVAGTTSRSIPRQPRCTLRTARLVEVVDSNAGKVVGQITQLHGVHGVAVAPEFGKGFITNGQSNSVTIFDLKTLAKVGEPQTGMNPDSVCFEPKTKHIFTFNGRSNDSTAIDPKTNEVIKTFPLGGKPEECAADGTGMMYANLEDSSEMIEIDAAKTTSYAACLILAVR